MDLFEEDLQEDPTIMTINELAVIMEMEQAIVVGAHSSEFRPELHPRDRTEEESKRLHGTA